MKIIDAHLCKYIGKKYNNQLKNKWYGLQGINNIGCVTYLYKKYGCPETYQEFYNKYVSDEYDKDNPQLCGRSEQWLEIVAGKLAKFDGNKEDFDIYYNWVVQKIIIDTLDGSKKETELKNRFTKAGYRCEEPTYIEDKDLSIDFKVYKNDILYCLVQVKPHTFFLGNNNASLINDRKKALYKEIQATTQFKVPLIYVIYNKRSGNWIKNAKGNLSHKLTNLINFDGTTKNAI